MVTPATKRCHTGNTFPISCANCQETSDAFLSADASRHVVSCSKCNTETLSSTYSPKAFVDACMHSKNAAKSGSTTFKKHTESMYLSQQASLKYAENEAGLIEIRKREIKRQAQEAQEWRALDQKTTDTLGKLITQQAEQQAKQSEQQLAFTERFATIIEKIIPKRSAFEVYEDNKKRIQCMLEHGDIDQEEASVLLGNIKRELLSG